MYRLKIVTVSGIVLLNAAGRRVWLLCVSAGNHRGGEKGTELIDIVELIQ